MNLTGVDGALVSLHILLLGWPKSLLLFHHLDVLRSFGIGSPIVLKQMVDRCSYFDVYK